MRDMARRIIRRVGVETGGSNIQFAVNPEDGRIVAIEMNPRVSRSSALASKATGFPIAKIAAKLALGYHLDEIPNDITRLTPASFEPTIDYIVVKFPRWNFEKFPQADRTLTTQMKSVGEAMAIGRTFKEAFLKAVRSLELGKLGQPVPVEPGRHLRRRRGRERAAQAAGGAERPAHVGALPRAAARLDGRDAARADEDRSAGSCSSSPRSCELREHGGARRVPRDVRRPAADAEAHRLRDADIAAVHGVGEELVRQRRLEEGLVPAYKRIDTCAAEFESFTPYMYGTYEQVCEADPTPKQEGHHPRQRPQPDRPGHRVRLLLLSRRLRLPRGRLRDGDGELQPGDGLDRLRHRRSPLLRAADVRRRDGDHRARAQRRRRGVVRRAVRRPDAAQAGAGAAGGGRADSRHVARLDRPGGGSPALLAAAVGPRRAAAGERHRRLARGSARSGRAHRLSRSSCGRRTCSAAAAWRLCSTPARSIAT